jgi:hypothetical protein
MDAAPGIKANECWFLDQLRTGEEIVSAPEDNGALLVGVRPPFPSNVGIRISVVELQSITVIRVPADTEFEVKLNTDQGFVDVLSRAVVSLTLERNDVGESWDTKGQPKVINEDGHFLFWCKVAERMYRKQNP